MTTLTIDKIEFDLEFGFVWAENKEGENIFQACLKTGKKGGNIKAISRRDNGSDDGICGDYNSKFHDIGSDEFYSFENKFLSACRKAGIKIVS